MSLLNFLTTLSGLIFANGKIRHFAWTNFRECLKLRFFAWIYFRECKITHFRKSPKRSYSRGLIFANGKIKLKLNRVKALISEWPHYTHFFIRNLRMRVTSKLLLKMCDFLDQKVSYEFLNFPSFALIFNIFYCFQFLEKF